MFYALDRSKLKRHEGSDRINKCQLYTSEFLGHRIVILFNMFRMFVHLKKQVFTLFLVPSSLHPPRESQVFTGCCHEFRETLAAAGEEGKVTWNERWKVMGSRRIQLVENVSCRNLGVEPKKIGGKNTQIFPLKNRVFHYFHHPFWG